LTPLVLAGLSSSNALTEPITSQRKKETSLVSIREFRKTFDVPAEIFAVVLGNEVYQGF
jgi:hypothetical protein